MFRWFEIRLPHVEYGAECLVEFSGQHVGSECFGLYRAATPCTAPVSRLRWHFDEGIVGRAGIIDRLWRSYTPRGNCLRVSHVWSFRKGQVTEGGGLYRHYERLAA